MAQLHVVIDRLMDDVLCPIDIDCSLKRNRFVIINSGTWYERPLCSTLQYFNTCIWLLLDGDGDGDIGKVLLTATA
jgi:hypothetical protein